MLGWFRAMMPKEERFFDLYEQHARTLVTAAEALQRLLRGEGAVAEHCRAIVAEEERADAIAAEVMLAIRRTFITPFDRGDIEALITAMDDAVDQMQKTVKAITLFEVSTFEPQMAVLGDIIVEAAGRVAELVPLLRDLRRNAARINALTGDISRIEERSDETCDDGIKALFAAHRHGDAMPFIVGSEIYDHLEEVVDRLEDVAKCVGGIVIEQI
jgi:uncharacterized protein